MGKTLKIMPIGDSITRGTYLAAYTEGPFAGQAIGLPHPNGGGWRKPLQDKLREAGIDFAFVGELDYGAYGQDAVMDSDFQPAHHGLAGFGNQRILDGGVVPTPLDVLAARGLTEIRVPDIVTVLARHRPDIVLLMSGSNGFGSTARNLLMRTIRDHFDGYMLVATIPPQCPPRMGFEQVEAYNASLPDAITKLDPTSERIRLVDINRKLDPTDLTNDGVHPNRTGMEKIATAWFVALKERILKGEW